VFLLEDVWANYLELLVLLELMTLNKHKSERQKNTYCELHVQNESDWMLIPLLLNVEKLTTFK